MMLQMSGLNLPVRAMRQQIGSALDVLVHTARLGDGTRKVIAISEIVGMEGDMIMLQELIAYHKDGVDEDGRIVGRFLSTGMRPHFLDQLKASGHDLDLSIFDKAS
jgi:pilus assembly protein CpaF